MTELKLSVASPLPEVFELVALTDAKTADGEPLVVRCEKVRPRDSLHIVKQLPGDAVQMGPKAAEPMDFDQLEPMLPICEQLIERGTALADPNGGFVRPAFWFDASRPRHELSLDGSLLSFADVIALGTTILKISGFSGGAATNSFPG